MISKVNPKGYKILKQSLEDTKREPAFTWKIRISVTKAPLYLCLPLPGRVPPLHYSSCFPHYCYAMGLQTSATTD